jgi:hypothetical protein
LPSLGLLLKEGKQLFFKKGGGNIALKSRFKVGIILFLLMAVMLPVSQTLSAVPTQDLADLTPAASGYENYGTVFITGVSYPKSIYYSFDADYDESTATEYNLGYKYEKLVAVVGMGDDSEDATAIGKIKIYGDSVLLYDSGNLSLGQKKDVSINVSNVLRLKIEFIPVSGNDEYIYYSDLALGSPTLTIKDTTPPNVSLSVPKVSSNSSASTTFPVIYSVSDPSPASGVKSWKLQVKDGASGTWSNWKTGSTGLSKTSKSYIGGQGKTYYFRLIATDNKSNSKTSSTVFTVVPYDETSVSYSSGWGKWSSSVNYGGSTRYNNLKGSWAKFSFSGSAVYLISPKTPNLGKADIYLDGIYQATIDLYSSSNKYRQVVYSKSLASGSHALKVVVKNQKNSYSNSTYVHLDGVGVKK